MLNSAFVMICPRIWVDEMFTLTGRKPDPEGRQHAAQVLGFGLRLAQLTTIAGHGPIMTFNLCPTADLRLRV